MRIIVRRKFHNLPAIPHGSFACTGTGACSGSPLPSSSLSIPTEEPATGHSGPTKHLAPAEQCWSENLDIIGTIHYSVRPAGRHFQGEARAELHLPFLGFFLWPIFAMTLRSRLKHAQLEKPVTAPWWAPPAPFSPQDAAAAAALCAALSLLDYTGTLFTQTAGYFSASFQAENADLAAAAAITRVGALFALAGAVFADRRGRRKILMMSLTVVTVCTIFSAVAPDLKTFTLLQVGVRSGVNLGISLIGIGLIENAPEGCRPYILAVTTMISGASKAIAVILLVIADFHPEAWRFLFALATPLLFFLPKLFGVLPESRRFLELAAQGVKMGRLRALFSPRYSKRLLILVLSIFLLQLGAAPAAQLKNDYLRDEHAYSAFSILIMSAVTQGPLPLMAVFLGGRLAETAGRKPLTIFGTLLAMGSMALFYLGEGAVLWITLAIATTFTGLSAPAWGTMTTEMFPTETRGSSNGTLLVAGIFGSVTGLALTGMLEGPLGSFGTAIAAVSAAPIFACCFLLPFLPESKNKKLDEISPPTA